MLSNEKVEQAITTFNIHKTDFSKNFIFVSAVVAGAGAQVCVEFFRKSTKNHTMFCKLASQEMNHCGRSPREFSCFNFAYHEIC